MIAAGIWLQQCCWNSPEGYRWHWDHPDYIETQHSMTFVQNLSELYIPSMCSSCTVYPNKYAHGFVVLCFVVVMQSFIMNSHEVFIHIHQGCFAGTGAIVRLPQCQWSKPDGYGKISQCITTTKHSKAKTVCIFLGIYCIWNRLYHDWWLLFCLSWYAWLFGLGINVIAHNNRITLSYIGVSKL